MKQAVAEKREPIFSGFEKLRAHPASRADYVMLGPAEEIGRNPSVNQREFDTDANASYECALMWCLTGERGFAEKARRIIDAWCARLRRVNGADAVLMAGLGPFKMLNAAELLRHTEAGWRGADVARAERMFREVIYPPLKDFAPFANGNWDTAAIKTVLAIGVFCDDREMAERALRYYVHGAGNGRLTHYILNEAGQCQESGRDQQHAQLGLGHLGDTCEIAWHQGFDLYGYADNRLLRGFEYMARYNLGEDVPFIDTLDRSGKYHHTRISSEGRGRLRPIYEQIFNHYVNRAGLAAPWTQRAAEKLRPEGEARPNADHPGFGTLCYTRPAIAVSPNTPPVAPAAVIATGSAAGNTLTWIASIGAQNYCVKREGRIIGANVRVPSFTDASVAAGKLYTYTVCAINALGSSSESLPVAICAGLPAPWRSVDIGAPKLSGSVQYDGRQFTFEAAGADIGHGSDQFLFLHAPLAGDGSLVARFLPQVSAQSSKFGVMLRDSTSADAPFFAVLFSADGSRERERPRWHAEVVARNSAGASTRSLANTEPLPAPTIAYGRFVEPYWLRLERRGDTLVAAASADGKAWRELSRTSWPTSKTPLAGIAVCSRVPGLSTHVTCDHVSLNPIAP